MVFSFLGLDHPLWLVDGFQVQAPGPCGEELVQPVPGEPRLHPVLKEAWNISPQPPAALTSPFPVESLPLYLAQ